MKTTIFYVIITVILGVTYTVYMITQKSNEELARYKQEEIYKIKKNLKNFVEVAYSTIDFNYKNSLDKKYLEKHYGSNLKNIIDVVKTILKLKAEKVKTGKLTLAEAQAEAIKEIQSIRYNEGTGYIWINDTTRPYPKMIMHPTIPSLNGQILDDPKYNSAMGKDQNFFAGCVEVAQKKGGGFVDYLWPKSNKNGGFTPNVPRMAYVKLFPEWNWIIGTNLSVDDAILDGIEKSKDEIRQMRYNNGVGFFWINNTDESAPWFYMYPIALSIENIVLSGGHLDKLGSVIKSFISIGKQKGSGYVEYRWDKPSVKGIIKDVPKLSYVKLYEPLGWIIGTGVYLDDIDKNIAREKNNLNQRLRLFIINMLVTSIILILFISILHYVIGRYFFSTPIPAAADSKSIPAKEEIPTTSSQETEPQQQAVISVKDSLKFTQEISKTIIEEQTKLLAFAVNMQTTQEDKVVKDNEMANEVKQLAEEVYQLATEVHKMAKTIHNS